MTALDRSRLALCVVAFLTCAHVAAAQDWSLIGLGQHQETGRDIYLGGIYLAAGTPRPADFSTLPDPWKMEFRIVARRTSIRSLLGGMLLQSEVATGRSPGPATTEFADGILSAIRSSLYAGDAFAIELEGDITYALLNDQVIARSSNPGVASYFLMGWISEQGPASSFRNSLLSAEIDPDLLAQRNTLKYSPERGAEVATWVGVAEPAEPEGTQPVLAPGGAAPGTEEPANATALEGTTTPGNTLPAGPLTTQSPLAPGAPIAVTQDTALAPTTTVSPNADFAADAATPGDPGNVAFQAPLADSKLQPVEPFNVATPTPATTEADAVMALGVQEYSQRLAAFQGSMVAMVYSKIRYPKRAVRRNLQGRLELDVVLSAAGELRSVEVVSSSGHEMLDNAAVDAAEDAFRSGVSDVDPVARAEFAVGPNEIIVPVPVQFRLQ